MNFLLSTSAEAIVGAVLVAIILVLTLWIIPFGAWFKAMAAGAKISLGRLVGMRLRKTKPTLIVEVYITAKKADVDVSVDIIEACSMARGSVNNFVNILICAHVTGKSLDPRDALTIDLMGISAETVSSHHAAGGDFNRVLSLLKKANAENAKLSVEEAMAKDLSVEHIVAVEAKSQDGF